jgi:predicted Zn-dependent peptidase
MTVDFPKAEKTILANGVKIVTESITNLRAITIGILVGAGSATEEKNEAGISHFIEHMVFKGTKKRNPFEIATTLDEVAGKINAFTGKEYTCYYVVILDTHHDIALDVLFDIFLNSVYAPSDIELEKGVVLEEVNMYEDTPDENIHDIFTSTLLHGHPIGNSILGTAQTINNFNRNAILKYREKLYTPDNIIIAVAGDITHKKIVKEITPLFKGLTGKREKRQKEHPTPKGTIRVINKKTEQLHLCLGSSGPAMHSSDRYPMVILENVLGGNMSSRLFQEVREKRGLAYAIFSSLSPYTDAGTFYTYAGCTKENAKDVINLVLAELASFKKEGVSKKELERAKEYIKGTLVLGMESTSSRMNWMARNEFFHDRSITINEVFKEIDRATNDDLIASANKYIDDKYLTLTMIGDINESPVKKLSC